MKNKIEMSRDNMIFLLSGFYKRGELENMTDKKLTKLCLKIFPK